MSRKDDFLKEEEEFFSNDRKDSRKERRLASFKDRSKFKKSDQDQLKKQAVSVQESTDESHLREGRVLAIDPEGITVDSNHLIYTCTLKGVLKRDKTPIKNLVAIGDFVLFEEREKQEGSIVKVKPRYSILSRADNLSRNKEQLIAVNIDQVLITCSVLTPPLKPFLVDRYIIAAQKGNMKPVILVNKIDFLSSPPSDVDAMRVAEERALYEEFLEVYRSLHIKVIGVSAKTNEGMDELKAVMSDKTSVFSGQSGVGKSSLINLVTGHDLPTGKIVHKTGKGSHTTTTSRLIPLAGNGFCIDTPGIKSFGLWDIGPAELASYFSEIYSLSSHCKFPDCSHLIEPGCAVRDAVEEMRISPLRFASYSALMTSLSEEHRHR
jgi:ribosome biogenesis GTPase